MSHPQPAKPAKLVIGLLLNNKDLLPGVAHDLERVYGEIDLISPWMDFNYTDYYAPEMGKSLYRRLLVFKELIAQLDLARIKLHTNEIELKYADEGRRCVNIDPGYLLYERFVLATGKNYSHRIHIGHGIYADLTLIYQHGAYQPLPWTYPDYADAIMGEFLMQVRQKYSADIKGMPKTENLQLKE
jgi:hypothetical protein